MSADLPALRVPLAETQRLDAGGGRSAPRDGGQDEDRKLHPLYAE